MSVRRRLAPRAWHARTRRAGSGPPEIALEVGATSGIIISPRSSNASVPKSGVSREPGSRSTRRCRYAPSSRAGRHAAGARSHAAGERLDEAAGEQRVSAHRTAIARDLVVQRRRDDPTAAPRAERGQRCGLSAELACSGSTLRVHVDKAMLALRKHIRECHAELEDLLERDRGMATAHVA
jgi:hypothetical protein